MTTKTIEQRLSELEGRAVKLEEATCLPLRTTHAGSLQKKVSAKEFLITKKFKSEAQRTLVLGYYLEHMEDMPSFNISDLAAIFQSAREKRPANMNDAVNRNVARGLLMEATGKKDSKKVWILTSTGEKYVEEELNK